jgi:hypothetical protein
VSNTFAPVDEDALVLQLTNDLGSGDALLFKGFLGYLDELGNFDEKEKRVRGVISSGC